MSEEKIRIDDETIGNISILAKLELNDEEREQARQDLTEMLSYIDTLNELDTEGIEPMVQTYQMSNVFREDVVTNGDGSTEALANAPAVKNSMYQVLRTFE